MWASIVFVWMVHFGDILYTLNESEQSSGKWDEYFAESETENMYDGWSLLVLYLKVLAILKVCEFYCLTIFLHVRTHSVVHAFNSVIFNS
jgi:hypothetical protein